MGGNGRDLEYIGQHELGVAINGVLFEQVFENLARLRPVALKEVEAGLTELLRTLSPRAEGGVEGKMTNQVERIGVRLLGCLGKFIEADPPLGKAANDLRSLCRISPL